MRRIQITLHQQVTRHKSIEVCVDDEMPEEEIERCFGGSLLEAARQDGWDQEEVIEASYEDTTE